MPIFLSLLIRIDDITDGMLLIFHVQSVLRALDRESPAILLPANHEFWPVGLTHRSYLATNLTSELTSFLLLCTFLLL